MDGDSLSKTSVYKEAEIIAKPLELLDESCEVMKGWGGFDLIKEVEGAYEMNPATSNKTRKKIFLGPELDKKAERQALKTKLQLWLKMFSEASSVPEMISK